MRVFSLIRNYIIMAARQMRRNKIFTAINIAGLSFSLTACLLMLLFIQKELSHNRSWTHADELHQLVSVADHGIYTRISPPIASLAKNYFPEIEAMSFVSTKEKAITIGDKEFSDIVVLAQEDIQVMFDFHTVSGDMAKVVSNPNSIALSQTTAEKFFAGQPVLGQSIIIDDKIWQVDAIYEDTTENSSLQFPMLGALANVKIDLSSWFDSGGTLYFKVKKGTDMEEIGGRWKAFSDSIMGKKLQAYQSRNAELNFGRQSIESVPYTDTHLYALTSNSADVTPIEKVKTLGLVSTLLLTMACFNFISLSTARATKRAKEIAIRKIHGATRRDLIIQFMGEAFVLTLMSMLLAVGFAEILLPVFGAFMLSDLNLDYGNILVLVGILVLVLMAALGGGLYPAMVLSRFRPPRSLSSNNSSGNMASRRLRQALLVMQFGIATALIIITIAIQAQATYAKNMDYGFNPKGLIHIMSPDMAFDPVGQAFKSEVLKIPGVSGATWSDIRPMLERSYSATIELPNGENRRVSAQSFDREFFKTFETEQIAGRPFRRGPMEIPKGDRDVYEVMLNVSAVRMFGFNTPKGALGQRIDWAFDMTLEVVGVIPDINLINIYEAVGPVVYFNHDQESLTYLTLRNEGDVSELLAGIGEIWNSLNPDRKMHHYFANDLIKDSLADEARQSTALGAFSLLAVIVACLGLYGLVHFTAEEKIKEIGIRKVLGATNRQIMELLIWQLSKPILLAMLVASPIAIWLADDYLQKFHYRFDSAWLVVICVAVCVVLLAISWATTGFHSYRISRANPIKALRVE